MANKNIRIFDAKPFNYLTSFCSLATSVHDWPYVANTVIRKLTFPINMKVLSSLYDELEIDLELWPVIVVDRVVIVP